VDVDKKQPIVKIQPLTNSKGDLNIIAITSSC